MRSRRQSDIDRARGSSTVSEPAPINAVDISGYILLGTKRLNIHITLEDTETELEPDDRDQSDAGFGDEEDAEFDEDDGADPDDGERDEVGDEDDLEYDDEDDTEEDAEFDEEDEEDDAGFDEDDTEDDEDDTEDDDRAPAEASLRDLLRPRPRRPEVRYDESGGRDGGGRPRWAADDRRSGPRRQTSGRSSEGPDGRSSVPDADARRAGTSPPRAGEAQAGQPARRRGSGEGAARPRR
jgi:hypothetical protein